MAGWLGTIGGMVLGVHLWLRHRHDWYTVLHLAPGIWRVVWDECLECHEKRPPSHRKFSVQWVATEVPPVVRELQAALNEGAATQPKPDAKQ
jgi:hypothetical protein